MQPQRRERQHRHQRRERPVVLGAEHDASWSIDSDESGLEKLESGFNATLRDREFFLAAMAANGGLRTAS